MCFLLEEGRNFPSSKNEPLLDTPAFSSGSRTFLDVDVGMFDMFVRFFVSLSIFEFLG